MKFKKKISRDSYGTIFLFSEKEALQLKEKLGKRVIYIINKKHQFHGAIQFSKKQGHFIHFSKARIKSIGLAPNELIHVEIKKDNSTYQFAICEEFTAVFETDELAQAKFDKLSDGKKRGLIHYVNSAKRVETRINRALKLAENLKLNITDPRQLIK
jgi:CRISPR/Cas system-associated exonuclease Cas4 (RecB family)